MRRPHAAAARGRRLRVERSAGRDAARGLRAAAPPPASDRQRGAISSNVMPNTSCSTNASRSGGSSVSMTRRSASPTESASTAVDSGSRSARVMRRSGTCVSNGCSRRAARIRSMSTLTRATTVVSHARRFSTTLTSVRRSRIPRLLDRVVPLRWNELRASDTPPRASEPGAPRTASPQPVQASGVSPLPLIPRGRASARAGRSIRFEASAFESVSSSSVARLPAQRSDTGVGIVIGSSPVFHSSGSPRRAGLGRFLTIVFYEAKRTQRAEPL